MSRIRDNLPGVPPLHEDLPFLVLVALAAAAGFFLAMLYYGEKLRQARQRARRAETTSERARKLYDDYRARLGPSAIQAEKNLNNQERDLAVLRFQVASLRSELKALQPVAERRPEPEVIDLRHHVDERRAG